MWAQAVVAHRYYAIMTTNWAEEIQLWIDGRARKEIIHEHGFRIPLRFWERIEGLPGAPLAGELLDARAVKITRGTLFDLAEAAQTDTTGTAALRLYWATLAWGTGASNRNNNRRIDAIRGKMEATGKVLQEAAVLSVRYPEEAFELLHPRGRNKLGWLGPNFSTKFLYFAGAGKPEHPCQIIDSKALATAHKVTGDPSFRMPPGVFHYNAQTYAAVLQLFSRLASEASTSCRPVAADEVERWAFGR